MASTYTQSGIELIGTGEQSGTWGDTTNTNLQIVDRLINGVGEITLSGTTHTLTTSDGALSDGQYKVLVFGGTPSGTNTVTISPNDADHVYIVKNNSGQSVVLTQGSGGNVTVADGKSALVYADGAGAGAAVVDITSTFNLGTVKSVDVSGGTTGLTFSGGPVTTSGTVTLAGTLAVANGGTGITSFGAGIATWLGTPSSANLASALTDETGSGSVVFSTSPTLVTPAIGTPSSGTLSNCTVDGTSGVGYINLPQNSKSADYTLVAADAGKHIFHPSSDANPRTFTIPANASVAYPVGTAVTFINASSSDVTISITSDTMYLAANGNTGSRTLAEHGVATAVKVDSTVWYISGSGLT